MKGLGKAAWAAVMVLILPLTGCGAAVMGAMTVMKQLADVSGISSLGLDLSAGTVVREEDTHGGFHGDGRAFAVVTFDAEDREALEADMNGDGWHPLPMTENAARAVRELAAGEDGKRLFPKITQGCYYFRDRHSQSTDPEDDSGLFSRSSLNFTMAVYDSETGTLYYFELDT